MQGFDQRVVPSRGPIAQEVPSAVVQPAFPGSSEVWESFPFEARILLDLI